MRRRLLESAITSAERSSPRYGSTIPGTRAATGSRTADSIDLHATDARGPSVIGAVRPIDAASTRELRHELLRPAQAPEELVYDGDDAWDTLHLGAFQDERLVGIATVMRAPPPGIAEERAWRVRGMATLPEVRGRGYGGMLLERCLQHAAERGGDLVWCTARVGAIGFYRRYGFDVEGKPFDVPGAGEHVLARRPLRSSASRTAPDEER